MRKWGILFTFSFGSVWATKDKEIKGEKLTWNTREEAENWARHNCGPNFYEAVELEEAQ